MNTKTKDENETTEVTEAPVEKGHVHGPNCNHGHHHHFVAPITRVAPKVGRNEDCTCGSGKKFKKCCGK